MGLLGRHAARLRAVLSIALLAAFVVSGSGVALAGTTGVINGTVVDATNSKPLADVRVTASSASGRYQATTDARGFYSMAGVPADTYTMSFQRDKYEPLALTGVTVFADQTMRVDERISPSLVTIATVRSAPSISAYRPAQTTDTYSVSSTQVQNFQGSSFNTNEANLITSLPGAMADSSGFPVIHGGREYENDFEFEGIPYVDAYSNQFTNALSSPTIGISEVQLTPGAGNATVSTNGQGSFNVVAKRGTYPAYSDLGVGVGGGGGFNHNFIGDFSWATPDGTFSDYATFHGQNESAFYGDGSIPAAYIGAYGGRRLTSSREFLNNFVWRFGKAHNQSLQIFADVGETDIYTGYGGLQGLCFMTCDPVITQFYGGIWGLTPTQMENITPMIAFQTSPTETLAQASRSPLTYFEPNAAYKAEYTLNLNSSTYLSEEWYRVNSVTTFDIANTLGGIAGDGDILQGGQTTGLRTELTKQLGSKHLLQLGFDYNLLHPIDSWTSPTFQYLGTLIGAFSGNTDQYFLPYGFINPTTGSGGPCPLGTDPSGTSYCGYAYQAYPNAAQLTYPPFDQIATVNRQDYSAFVNDQIDFNDRLKANVGLRMDNATYRLPTPHVDPHYCTALYLPTTWTANPNYNAAAPFGDGNCPFNATFDQFNNSTVKPSILQPRLGLSYKFGDNNTALRLTYSRSVTFSPIGTVAFGQIDQSAFEVPYGNLPAYNVFYNLMNGLPANQTSPANQATTSCGIIPYIVQCRDFGEQLYWLSQNFDGIPYQPVKPETANNYQLTIQHQFTRGILQGVALSVAPWYRKQYDTTAQQASLILGPNGQPQVFNGGLVQGPATFNNNAKEYATGVDLNITKTNPYGLSGQLTASYINEFSSVIPLSSSEDFYPNIPLASLYAGNVYRVGFVSPLQATLALSYKTRSGWTINPRYYYNIGYPASTGLLTAAFVNGVALNVPNSDAVVGSSPNGPACFVDPTNPGSVFNPNCIATTGTSMKNSPGAVLSPPNSFTDITLSYNPPRSAITYGLNVNNVFNQFYNGAVYNGRFQPVATGVGGPLSGWSTSGTDYSPTAPYAWPQYLPGPEHGQNVYVNIPNGVPRNFYFFAQVKI